MRTVLAALVTTAAALLVPSAAHALTLRPCPGQPGFGCGTLRVPLDRTGAVPGRIALRVAVQDTRAARAKPKLLVALTGGPGQGGVAFASSFASTLQPLLGNHRLAVIDQRGTGGSGALDCPAIQALDGLDAFTPSALAACARRLGPRRRSFTTADTVADLDALRTTFAKPRLTLMGVSYGTHVAQQYARTYPTRTDRLILDSPVAPSGVDPFLLDTFARTPRVLRDQCARSACRGITADPVADLAALVPRLARGAIRGRTHDARGRARTTSFTSGEELFFALIAADLNPYLQAALPAAIAAARAGDAAPLVRLRRAAAGGPSPRTELSGALNVATSCQDVALPYALSTPFPERPALAEAALTAVDPARYAPWDRATVLASGYVEDCLRWPDGGPPQSRAPLPDVPTLVLSGRLDLRTPLENGDPLLAALPRAQRVIVGGTGHDVLDSDLTGCARRALERFAGGRRVGSPCAGETNAVDPTPRPPRSLASYPVPRAVPGDRGRVVLAVRDTILDAELTALQLLFSGLPAATGGLRGGRLSAPEDFERLTLADSSYLRGVRVSGRLDTLRRGFAGTLRIDGPGGLDGTLRVDGEELSGTLGGRAVRYRPASARAASPGSASPRRALERRALPARGIGAASRRSHSTSRS